MRTKLVASVVAILVGGLWLATVSVGECSEPSQWSEGSGLSEPKVVHKVSPVYPEDARAEGVQGAVVLHLTVDTAGAVSAVTVQQDPDARLSRAAVDAAQQWRFEPARSAQGEPVAVVYAVTIAFKLQ